MNPLCACGCGWEVSLPWNKWIQGHTNKRNKGVAIDPAEDDGQQGRGRIIKRWPDVIEEQKQAKEIGEWRTGKRKYKEVKEHLNRHRSRLQTAA